MMSLMAIGSHDGALKEGLPSVSGQLGLIAVMDTMTGGLKGDIFRFSSVGEG